jgi:hypothetical protein
MAFRKGAADLVIWKFTVYSYQLTAYALSL